MIDGDTPYHIRAIRALLRASFDGPRLKIFCHDYRDRDDRPLFAPVLTQFAVKGSADDWIETLIDYAGREDAMDELLAEMERLHPGRYAEMRPYVRAGAPTRGAPLPLPPRDTLPDPGPLPPGSRLPFVRNALFTGRLEPLKALARRLLGDGAGAALAALVTQAVAGMGGVGKTQLAVEFCCRYGRYFRGVHWINAAQPDGIGAEVAACGAAMCLPEWPQEQPEQVALTVKLWAESGPRLVVLDNLEDEAAAGEWLARLGTGGGARVLVTARRANWPKTLGLSLLPLDLFSADESRAFLRQYVDEGRAADAELDELAGQLGCLPLALELAGRYLSMHQRLTVAGYRQKLAGALAHPSMRGWQPGGASPTGHDLDLVATFALSWERVENPAARRVFTMAGYCAPNVAIPCELLERAADLDAEACDEAVGELAGLGLAQRGPGAAGPSLHPLLAEFGRGLDRAAPESALPALAAALVDLSYEANETLLPARFAPLLAHVEAAAAHAEAAGLAEGAGPLWNNLGCHRQNVADYAAARAAYERALRIDEQVYGPDHPEVATDVNNLGLVLRALGDLPAARAAFERALRIFEQVLPPNHPNIQVVRANLASLDDRG